MPDPSPCKKKKGKKKAKKATQSIVLQIYRLSLGQGDGCNLYTEGSHVVCAAIDSALWGKKPKPKNPFHFGAKVPMHRALVWGKILYASLGAGAGLCSHE